MRLCALLHDAPEYVIGDLISPFKAAVGLNYKAFELQLQRAIHIRFGLPPELSVNDAGFIKRADKIAAFYEATCLAGFTAGEAAQFFGTPPKLSGSVHVRCENLASMPAGEAQAAYLDRFHTLMHEIDAQPDLPIAKPLRESVALHDPNHP